MPCCDWQPCGVCYKLVPCNKLYIDIRWVLSNEDPSVCTKCYETINNIDKEY
jgi:hypothetical protein